MKTNKQRATAAKLLWHGGAQLFLLALLSVTLPALGYAATYTAGSANDGPSQRRSNSGGSSSSSSNSSSPSYSMPPAAAQALERARQYQNTGDAINRGLDNLRDSYERDRQREEERDRQREEREEQARQREEERQERSERARQREDDQRRENARSYQPAPARAYQAPAYQPAAPAQVYQAPAYQPPPPPPPPTSATHSNDFFEAAMRYQGADAGSENSSTSLSDRLHDYGVAFKGGAQSMWHGLLNARDAAKPYVQDGWNRLTTKAFNGDDIVDPVQTGAEVAEDKIKSLLTDAWGRVTNNAASSVICNGLAAEECAQENARLQYNKDTGNLITPLKASEAVDYSIKYGFDPAEEMVRGQPAGTGSQ